MEAVKHRRKSGNSNGSGDLMGMPDPDNVPPQSRLFIVVPKTSDGSLIEVILPPLPRVGETHYSGVHCTFVQRRYL